MAGGRHYNNYPLLCKKLDHLLQRHSLVEIVSGGASGADKLGERYASERGYSLSIFPADWSLGKRAGPIRNEQMAKYATHLVAFPGGRGTANMIEQAKANGLHVRVVGT